MQVLVFFSHLLLALRNTLAYCTIELIMATISFMIHDTGRRGTEALFLVVCDPSINEL